MAGSGKVAAVFLLGCDKALVEMPSGPVFTQLSLGVDEGDRIGIVGTNGAGKSTLLRLLAGRIEPDEGRVIRTGGVSIGMLDQQDDLDPTSTVGASIVGNRPTYEWAADEKIRAIIDALAGDLDWDAPIGILSGGQRRRIDLARLLCGEWDVLALDEPTNHLDIAAIAWLADHLRTRWKTGRGALLVVTHDRWFLDAVCTTMWEVHGQSVRHFEGGFSAYIEQRVERDRQERVSEIKRQNALRRELAWLSRGARARATKPKFHVEAVRELIADVPELRNPVELKRMAMARLGKRVVELESVSVTFDDSDANGTENGRVSGPNLTARGSDSGPNRAEITPATSPVQSATQPPAGAHPTEIQSNPRTVLRDINWIIGPGDRIGIIGANGAGKTTLLRVITGALSPTRGRVVIGETVRFAVLSQHLEGLNLWGEDRVREIVGRFSHRIMLDGRDQTPAQLLENLGFSTAELNEKVCDLSGGQRRRLAIMLILLEEPNVIVLDEPGNDLDVDMLAALETLLDGWPGTLLIVTHDRYLMERTTDDQFAIIGGRLRHLPGGVEEYLRLERAEQTPNPKKGNGRAIWDDAVSATSPGEVADRGTPTRAPQPSAGRQPDGRQPAGQPLAGHPPAHAAARRRDLQKEVRSLERKRQTAADRQAAARAALEAIDPADYQALMEAQAALDELVAAADALDEQWLTAAEQLEEVEAILDQERGERDGRH